LEPKAITLIQQIVGTLLYYAMAIDPTMLVALGDLSSDQTRATSKTWDDIVWLISRVRSKVDWGRGTFEDNAAIVA
jgi:metallophosphoesterase superfamily enzyme